jgi:hypothetical protein
MMKAVLINPFNRTVTDVEGPDDGGIADALDCYLLDVIRVAEGVDIWVDDNGLAKPDQAYWRFKSDDAQSHIAGKALVLGHDSAGNTTDCLYLAVTIARVIEFVAPPTAEQLDKLQTITVTPF